MFNIEELTEQVKSVISFSQGIPDPKVEPLMNRWVKAKSKFIEYFGGLIYEWPEPIEFILDPKEKRVKAMEFIDYIHRTFENDELADFLDLNIDTFFDNKVSNAGNKNVPEGMKLIKAFKFFEKNKQALRDMQDVASQLIQENRVKGTLCFSVHPLDFLSSSENTYNWRSCHSLDGEYRAGNLSYMADETTFMVYLKGADNVPLSAFPSNVKWNSKKWRMLIHSSTDLNIMFAGRQYPFSSKSGIDTVLNIYNNILQNFYVYSTIKYGSWCSDYVDSYESENRGTVSLDWDYLIYGGQLIRRVDVVKSGINALNYNDVLYSTCYQHPYYAILNPRGYHDAQHLKHNPIYIGEEVGCLHCGEEIISNSETMRCDKCEIEFGYELNDNYGHCENCGCRIYFDDAYYVNDEYVCDHCFNNYCFICDNCGEAFYNEMKQCVEIAEDTVEYYCPHCAEHYKNYNY